MSLCKCFFPLINSYSSRCSHVLFYFFPLINPSSSPHSLSYFLHCSRVPIYIFPLINSSSFPSSLSTFFSPLFSRFNLFLFTYQLFFLSLFKRFNLFLSTHQLSFSSSLITFPLFSVVLVYQAISSPRIYFFLSILGYSLNPFPCGSFLPPRRLSFASCPPCGRSDPRNDSTLLAIDWIFRCYRYVVFSSLVRRAYGLLLHSLPLNTTHKHAHGTPSHRLKEFGNEAYCAVVMPREGGRERRD